MRGKLAEAADLSDEEAVEAGRRAGLRLHKFKRNAELPRVRRALGILHSIAPSTLLDVGSGRGTFLWPLLDQFPSLPVTSIDSKPVRATDINAVKRGGIDRLAALMMDATSLGFKEEAFDTVTILEVLEHLERPDLAIAEAIRVAQRFVLASMPSKEDDNPEHIHLFDKPRVLDAFNKGGAKKVVIEYVPNHMMVLATV
ncbi:MAG: class I SAM-dependent methyltransferase [Blastocatellia bacterium]